MSVIYSVDLETAMTQVRAGLTDAEFSALHARGAQLSFTQMVDLAGSAGDAERVATGQERNGLTPREEQVLRLVARGMTNAQVARALFVSSRTVNWHLTAIYAKLDVRSRTEAARYALDHGLR